MQDQRQPATPECTFERAGATELLSNFGFAICRPYELMRLNPYMSEDGRVFQGY